MVERVEIENGSEVYPGQLLVENTQELAAGPNTYTYMSKVYAQVAGYVQIVKANTWNKLPMDQITVEAIHSADPSNPANGENQ